MQIQKTSSAQERTGLKVLVYGQAGAGKTRLCATVPDRSKALILSAEAGLLSLRDFDMDYVAVSGMKSLQSTYSFLKSGDHHYEWICLDSISEIAEGCLAEEKASTSDGRKAYGEMADRMFKTLRAFRDLPLNVYMSAKMGRVEDEGRQLLGPMLPGRQLEQGIAYLFDEVFALHSLRQEDGTISRVLQTETDAKCVAKDRSGALASFEKPSLAYVLSKITSPKTETNGEPNE